MSIYFNVDRNVRQIWANVITLLLVLEKEELEKA